MTIDPNREAFEKVSRKRSPAYTDFDWSFNSDGSYRNSYIQMDWDLWNAALTHANANATIRSDNTQVIVNLQTENEALRGQVRVLQEALRRISLYGPLDEDGKIMFDGCLQCDAEWEPGVPENHLQGCLCALTNAKQLGKE